MTRDSQSSLSSSEASLNPLDVEADDGWKDVEPDQEVTPVVGLFDNETFSDVQSMLESCKSKHNFDLVAVVKELDLDFYDCVKLINFIRSEVKTGNSKPDLKSSSFTIGDKYLHPVLDDDALLFSLDEILDRARTGNAANVSNVRVVARVTELEDQLDRLQSQFLEYRKVTEKTLEEYWATRRSEAAPGSSASSIPSESTKPIKRDDDTHYFNSYAYNEIHEIMLKDTTRTSAYRDFIYDNKHLFAGKVVLDVGCGTGILSMFCAKAGAKKVIAVDNSDIILKAREIVFQNDLGDIITCVRGKIEEVTLPVDEVDIIVSEWMGYCLLYEAMLDSVLWARDRYLSVTGLMVPSHAVLRLAPISDPDYVADNVAYWHEVYGFRMSAMLEKIHDDVLLRSVTSDNVIAPASLPFANLPLHTITKDDLSQIRTAFEFSLVKPVDSLDGFVVWFDILFQTKRAEEVANVDGDDIDEYWKHSESKGIAFTTGPHGPETHWRSGMLLIDHRKKVAHPLKVGQQVKGSIRYKKMESNSRGLEIEMTWDVEGSEEKGEQMWVLQ